MGPSVERVLTISLNRSTPLNKMAAMPIYGKNTEKSSSPEPRIFSFETESWYIALGTQGVPNFFLNDGLRLIFFMANICIGKMLKSHFLKIYKRLIAEICIV